METVDSAHMRSMNSTILLRLIWREQEISRADISRVTGMSRSTVSTIVAELLERGLVSERGVGHSSGGRRPVMLTFHSDAFTILGVDLGTEHVSVAAMNLKGELRETRTRRCDMITNPQQACDLIFENLQSLRETAALEGRPVIGIGVALPCPVSPDREQNPVNTHLLPAWQDYNLRVLLKQKFELPVHFDNDANLGALAELWWNKESQNRDLAFIKMSTGIGAGLIIDGKIFRGSQGLTGELGHMRMQRQSSMKLYDILGMPAIMKRAAEIGEQIPNGRFASKNLEFAAVAAAMREGDLGGDRLLDEISEAIAQALSNLFSVLDLQEIVLGGNLQDVGELLLSRVRGRLQGQLFWKKADELGLRWSQLGESQIAQGAATLILDRALEDLSWFPLKNDAAGKARAKS